LLHSFVASALDGVGSQLHTLSLYALNNNNNNNNNYYYYYY